MMLSDLCHGPWIVDPWVLVIVCDLCHDLWILGPWVFMMVCDLCGGHGFL